ncbi:MAG TPA: alpha/beta hydrolase [Steroidobacteraceae bacterium]|nr:alpha/beta hydrolase [Steroidobacteraceae bacterium]
MTYKSRRTPRFEQLTVRGIRHHLTWWGEPTDTPVLLLHGFQDTGATWQFLVDCLPDSWSLVAPDWRGFGDTGWAEGGYWFPDYLADLDFLLEALTPGPARVIGHSMGANVAGLYAGVRPARFKWFVNLEGVGLPRTTAEMAPARFSQWLDELRQTPRVSRYASVGELAGILRSRNPRLSADHAEFVARAWTRETPDGEVRLAFDPRHRYVNPVLYRREEAEACWARVECPMLLVTGGNSTHEQRRRADFDDARVRELFRNSSIVTLPGLGHMMHHEDPQAVADCILEFERAQP